MLFVCRIRLEALFFYSCTCIIRTWNRGSCVRWALQLDCTRHFNDCRRFCVPPSACASPRTSRCATIDLDDCGILAHPATKMPAAKLSRRRSWVVEVSGARTGRPVLLWPGGMEASPPRRVWVPTTSALFIFLSRGTQHDRRVTVRVVLQRAS